MAYELHQQSGTETLDVTLPTGDSAPVEQARLQEFFERLETELENGHFFRSPELKPGMVNNIRSMFTRSDLTDQEVRTLHRQGRDAEAMEKCRQLLSVAPKSPAPIRNRPAGARSGRL